MKICFRVDASVVVGTGHVMRCLALADELRRRGAETWFICRDLPGNLCDLIEQKGYRVNKLSGTESQTKDSEMTQALMKKEADIDWLVIDNYDLDEQWERSMRSHNKKIMVIDDLADRQHDCDLLLDQNFYEDMDSRYEKLIPKHCQKLIGPQYALLRREFQVARKSLKSFNGKVKRILISFGGSDLTNETLKALEAVRLLKRADLVVDVVIGVNNPNRVKIEALGASMPQVTCWFNVSNMAELITAADIYIGAGGTNTWERCCLGLPSLVITVAQNQVQAIKDMAQHNLLYFIGENNKVSQTDIIKALTHCLENPALLMQYSRSSLGLVDGLGAQRCVQIMTKEEKRV